MNPKILSTLPELTKLHVFRNSVKWRLTGLGAETPHGIEVWGERPRAALRIWEEYSDPIVTWASAFGVPAELIIACILTESGGNSGSICEKPGYVSDDVTPERARVGLMQTLISTARETLQDRTIGRAWLLNPKNSIRAGTACIARQADVTHFDPPKVAAAYNVGGLYWNPSPRNRWKMMQYPIGTSDYVDRFVKWLNETFAMFQAVGGAPEMSFFRALRSVRPDTEQVVFAGSHTPGLAGLKRRDQDVIETPPKIPSRPEETVFSGPVGIL